MKTLKPLLFVLGIMLFSLSNAQDKAEVTPDKKEPKTEKTVKVSDQEVKFKIGGFVRTETYFDTYKSVTARDEQLYLYPSAPKFDANMNDINQTSRLGMASFTSRLNFQSSGLEIMGAKTSALIEGDFFGTNNGDVRHFRLRHAMIKMDWDKGSLIMGQYWHPMFVTKCFPKVLTFAVAVPFAPLSRSPQIRGTYKITNDVSISAAAVSHGYHKNSFKKDTEAIYAQKNSGIPDMQFQLMATPGKLVAGATAGYKVLQPRTKTDNGLKTEKQIGSYNTQVFAAYNEDLFSVKAMFIYGQNLSHLVMIGGYGAADTAAVLPDDYSYANLQTYSMWGEITVMKNPQIGLFGGITENLGSFDLYKSLGHARGENLVKTWRVSPRVTYTVKKLTLGFEYLFAGAFYGTEFDAKHNPIGKLDESYNHRFMLMALYKF